MRQLTASLAVLAAVLAPASAAADTAIVLAPLTTLGEERPAALRDAERAVEAGLRAVDGFSLSSANDARKATRKASRPKLRSCDGDAACLGELGRLVGAAQVVHGEVGGLGDAQVVYLALVDVASGRELRSTTLELGGGADGGGAAAAATRLLAPERYVGNLRLSVDVDGATIFLDGQELGTSPLTPRPVEVGSHALRVTHPEFHDFVRFVDTDFGAVTEVAVNLQAYPIVGRAIAPDEVARPIERGVPTEPTPWYRRWYTIAGGGALVLVTSAIVVGLATDGIEADRERTLP